MIGVKKALLFLGLLFLFSSVLPSVIPADERRLAKLRLDDDLASPIPSKNNGSRRIEN